MSKDNFYTILGISENASGDEIKKAYRALSMKYHPDKNPGKTDVVSKFQQINEAYETLGDETKRAEYNLLNNPFFKRMNERNVNNMYENMEIPMELFGALFGLGSMGMDSMGNIGNMGNMRDMGGNDMFMKAFPGIHVFHGNNPLKNLQKPIPIIKNVSISIEQVLSGANIPLDIDRWILENGIKIVEKETIYVNIPKGIDDNEIIILRDKGNCLNDTIKGDIKLFVNIVNNTLFKRSGLDLILEKSISLKDALCGFSFEIKYINGKSYTINNNSGNIIQPNYRKMIPNMGLVRDEHKGNLIIIFNLEFPEKLTIEQINMLREIL